MSKLIKSELLVESFPCRLEPPDPEAFFTEVDLAVALDAEAGLEADENPGVELDEAVRVAAQAEAMIRKARTDAARIAGEAEQDAGQIRDGARREAELILQNAQEESQRLLAAAKEQAIRIKDEALQKGLEAGLTQGRQKWEAQITTAAELAADIEAGRAARIAGSEPELLKMAVAVAEKILGAELMLAPSQQLALVKNALLQAGNASEIAIRINPEDLQLLDANIHRLREVFNEPKPIRLLEDPAIEPGGCYVETERGSADGRIRAQLDEIAREMLKVVRS